MKKGTNVMLTLNEETCCFLVVALKVTAHLALMEPLHTLENKHPTIFILACLCRHIGNWGGKHTVNSGDGDHHCAVQLPQHHIPLCTLGNAGKAGLVPTKHSQAGGRQL